MIKMKDIPGYEGVYACTKDGRIWSYPKKFGQYIGKGKFVSFSTQDGYRGAYMYKIGERKCMKVHRLVAMTYIPNPDNKPFINHKNGIRTDNRVENLEWCTHKENMLHARDVLKTLPKGKKIMQMKLNGEVCAIYESCYDAERETGNAHGNIFNTALGKFKHCGGYLWKFI